MRMRAVVLGIVLRSAALRPAPLEAQQLPEDSAIVVATAKYIRPTIPPGSVQFDARVIPETSLKVDVLSAWPHPTRNAGTVNAVTEILSVSVWPVDSTDACSQSERKLKADRFVLRFGPPEVLGDSATIWVYTFESDGASGVNVGMTEFLLRRGGTEWRVVKRLRRRAA
jgi:hypothetical protein